MKKTLILLLIVLVLIPLVYFSYHCYNKRPLYLAVASTFSGVNKMYGEEMLKGVQLYIDKINQEGGVQGKKILVVPFDDKGTMDGAFEISKEIVNKNNMLAVLGHYFSSTSVAASFQYEKNRIPSINASATSDLIPIQNQWFFRIIPPNSYQCTFLTAYAKSALGVKEAVIIHDNDSYGSGLNKYFQKQAHIIGIDILKTYEINSGQTNIDSQINLITKAINNLKQPAATIFIAVHALEAAKLVISIRKNHLTNIIMGGDSLASDVFTNKIQSHKEEKSSPGVYSKNVYTVSGYHSKLAGKKDNDFRNNFYQQFGDSPSIVAVNYYDAAHVFVEALKKINTNDYVNSIRKNLKQSLEQFYSKNKCIHGLTGRIFFDSNGDMKKSMLVTKYSGGKYVLAFKQYLSSSRQETTKSLLEKAVDEDLIAIDNKLFTKAELVFVGIDHVKIDSIQMNQKTFHASFEVSFRFQGNFYPENIEFINAASPVKFEKKQTQNNKNNDSSALFFVDGTFFNSYDLRSYPLDSQDLDVQFRMNCTTGANFFFSAETNKIDHLLLDSSKWNLLKANTYVGDMEDYISPESMQKKRFSTFNMNVSVKRSVNIYSFLAVAVAINVILFIGNFVSTKKTHIILQLTLGLLIINSFFHSIYAMTVMNISWIEYVYLFTYGIIFISIINKIGILCAFDKNKPRLVLFFKLTGIFSQLLIISIFFMI
ncbi:branched chain amino acid ABC transporter (substrate-binding protein) [Candidatus Magnetomorum sp. HK-1]|nr:branched chain amino acid ABC transporter (substrate-binding protein) [Candidatus Magnetomorum sp. HK-1]